MRRVRFGTINIPQRDLLGLTTAHMTVKFRVFKVADLGMWRRRRPGAIDSRVLQRKSSACNVGRCFDVSFMMLSR